MSTIYHRARCLRQKGKTFKAIGDALGLGTTQARHAVKQGERLFIQAESWLAIRESGFAPMDLAGRIDREKKTA